MLPGPFLLCRSALGRVQEPASIQELIFPSTSLFVCCFSFNCPCSFYEVTGAKFTDQDAYMLKSL